MSDGVLVARDGAIATVTLNKPERLNALDKGMWRALGEIFTRLDADESLRCVILRGAGEKAFAAGADIAEFATERANVEQAREYDRVVHPVLEAIARCRHPVVAMIRGACVGGGLEVAAVCDLRICGESSRFGIPVKNLGLVVAYGELQGLIDLVGRAAALEIARLEHYLPFLATTASATPFIGLFGTVWGVMAAFHGIGAQGSASLAVVAPGISEALIATAAGLGAAIPAVIGYNYFVNRVKHWAVEMEGFTMDLLNLLSRPAKVGRAAKDV